MDVQDLRRGIRLAFTVPETCLAPAIVCIEGGEPSAAALPAALAQKCGTLTTHCARTLCTELLRTRLERSAHRMGRSQRLDEFYGGRAESGN